MMSPLTSKKKQTIRKTVRTRPSTPRTDVEGLGKDLTCNEADVDDLLSSGESTT
jgi:hypothetical protein